MGTVGWRGSRLCGCIRRTWRSAGPEPRSCCCPERKYSPRCHCKPCLYSEQVRVRESYVIWYFGLPLIMAQFGAERAIQHGARSKESSRQRQPDMMTWPVRRIIQLQVITCNCVHDVIEITYITQETRK